MTKSDKIIKMVRFPENFQELFLKYICEDEQISPKKSMRYYNKDGEFQRFCKSVAGRELYIKPACEGSEQFDDWCESNDDNWVFSINCVELIGDGDD